MSMIRPFGEGITMFLLSGNLRNPILCLINDQVAMKLVRVGKGGKDNRK